VASWQAWHNWFPAKNKRQTLKLSDALTYDVSTFMLIIKEFVKCYVW